LCESIVIVGDAMNYNDIKRKPDESLEEFLIRLGDNLELYGLKLDNCYKFT